MKKSAFLGLLAATTTLLMVLGCGQATTGKYTGQSVITLKGKTLQQPVTVDVSERLYKDYEGSYTLQTSNYQGNLQLRRVDGELRGRTIFTYANTATSQAPASGRVMEQANAFEVTNADSSTCQVELIGSFEIVEDTLNGKLCGADHACGGGSEVCVEFKSLKRTNNNNQKKTSNDWWSTPTTTLTGGHRS